MHFRKVPPLVFLVVVSVCFSMCSSTSVKDNGKKNGKDTTLYVPDFVFKPISAQEAAAYSSAVENFYEKRFVKTGFNGAILVAKNGQIVFEKYRGYSNFITKDSINEHSPFHLAS